MLTVNLDTNVLSSSLLHYKLLLKRSALVLSPAQFMEKFFPGQV